MGGVGWGADGERAGWASSCCECCAAPWVGESCGCASRCCVRVSELPVSSSAPTPAASPCPLAPALLLQASALALRKVPEVNASWHPDFIRQYHTVDCSVAVQVGGHMGGPVGVRMARVE